MPIAPEVYTRIIAAKVFIDQNFHKSIGLDCNSREACISRYHFHRLFTHIYNRTPHQYLTQKRISQALELLKMEELSVQEVCSSVGFESIGSFTVFFKREIGFPPHSYRKKAWLKQQQTKQEPEKFIPGCFMATFR
jgi:AraC-like DNA-binding protein